MTYFSFLIIISFAASALSIIFTYYFPGLKRDKNLWYVRFNKLGNLDHAGFILEIVFSFLAFAILLIFDIFLFPGISDLFFVWLGPLITCSILLPSLLVGTLLHCVFMGPKTLKEEFEDKIKNGKTTGEKLDPIYSLPWKTLEAPTKKQYFIYWIHSFFIFAAVLFLILFIILSSYVDGDFLKEKKLSITAFMENSPKIETLDESAVHKFEIAVYKFSLFENELLRILDRYSYVIALCLLLLWWYLYTRFQEIFIPFALEIIRTAVLVIIILVIPFFLGNIYLQLENTCDQVENYLESSVENVSLDYSGSKSLGSYNSLKNDFSQRASVIGFWWKLLNTGGGNILILTLLIPFAIKKTTKSSFAQFIVPDSFQIVGSIFRPVPKDDK